MKLTLLTEKVDGSTQRGEVFGIEDQGLLVGGKGAVGLLVSGAKDASFCGVEVGLFVFGERKGKTFKLSVELAPIFASDVKADQGFEVLFAVGVELVGLKISEFGFGVFFELFFEKSCAFEGEGGGLRGGDFDRAKVEGVEFVPLFELLVSLAEAFDQLGVGGKEAKGFFKMSNSIKIEE